jgi:hypothetical protein
MVGGIRENRCVESIRPFRLWWESKPHLQSRRNSMSSRVVRKSKSNETENFRGEVFGLNDLCRHFANPILRL